MSNFAGVFRAKLVLPVVLVVAIYMAIFQPFYFSHDYLPTHDFNVAFVSGHIMSNYLVNGFLPLWGPEQNCGAPVWPDVEVFPGFDPLSLLVNFVFALAGSSSVYAHMVTIFLWHLSFALGGLLFFRQVCRMSRGAALFGFTLLLFSNLTSLNFRQADDYITVYRYVPLLACGVYRFWRNPSLASSVLLGLLLGLNVCGYQSANVVMLLVFAGLAAIPLLGTPGEGWRYLKLLLPAAAISTLIAMPALVAGFFWLGNEVVARKIFQMGYRGGLGDLVGPLVKYYPDESAIYIGLLPALMAMAWLYRGGKRYFIGRGSGIAYWPDGFMLVFSALAWVMYIGFPENFTGIDRPFFEIRSFNNMLPFILFSGVFYAARMFELMEEAEGDFFVGGAVRKSWREYPLPLVLAATLAITVFTELSRRSLVSYCINHYLGDPGQESTAEVITSFMHRFSPAHWFFWVLYSLLGLGWLYGLGRHKRLFCLMSLAIAMVDLSLMNLNLLTSTENYAAVNPGMDIMPVLAAPMAKAPPPRRAMFLELPPDIERFKQGNIVYHKFSATTNDSVVWFRTRDFAVFNATVAAPEPFAKLTGVSAPLLYYVNRLLKVDRDQVLPTLNTLFTSAPQDFAMVGDKNEIPPGYPEVTGNLYPGPPPLVLEYGPNAIKLQTELKAPAYLVYLDAHTPDWRAYLDGERCELLRANFLFKAVLVPAGSHVVEFVYRPWPYLIAFWCRPFGWLLGLALLPWRRLSAVAPVTSERS